MTENNLLYFHEVAKYLNFSEAARRLSMTQPALSRQIMKLEDELGFDLFVRSTKEVSLTPGGLMFLKRHGEIVEAYTALLRDARRANEGVIGHLSIGLQEAQSIDGDFVASDFVPLIEKFKRQCKNVSIDVQCFYSHDLLEHIYTGKLDIAISLMYDKDSLAGLKYQTVDTIPSYLAVSADHPFTKSIEPNYAMLSNCDLLVMDESLVPHGADFLLAQCRECGIFPKEVKKAKSYSTISLWLSLNMGFSILNRNIWQSNARIAFVPLPCKIGTARVVYWSRSNRNPTVPMFLNSLSNR